MYFRVFLFSSSSPLSDVHKSANRTRASSPSLAKATHQAGNGVRVEYPKGLFRGGWHDEFHLSVYRRSHRTYTRRASTKAEQIEIKISALFYLFRAKTGDDSLGIVLQLKILVSRSLSLIASSDWKCRPVNGGACINRDWGGFGIYVPND